VLVESTEVVLVVHGVSFEGINKILDTDSPNEAVVFAEEPVVGFPVPVNKVGVEEQQVFLFLHLDDIEAHAVDGGSLALVGEGNFALLEDVDGVVGFSDFLLGEEVVAGEALGEQGKCFMLELVDEQNGEEDAFVGGPQVALP
jgi:hypothetical protein